MSRLPARILTIGLALAKCLRRRSPVENRAVRRILVAHYLLFGDTLLLAPLLAKLAREYPNAERIVLVRPSLVPLFQGKPWGFQALAYDPKNFATFRALQAAGPYDLAYVLGDNRYAWLARAIGAHWIIGFGNDLPGWKNWMLDEGFAFPTTPAALADMTAQLVPGIAAEPFRKGDWPAPKNYGKLNVPGKPYVVLHVGASSPLKFWPEGRWRQLAEQLQKEELAVVWSAGPGEEHLVDAIDPDHLHMRCCGTLDLVGLWYLLAGAKLLVSPDTGVAHLGKVVGVATIALFGPGAAPIYGAGEYWREAPYTAVTIRDFPCRNQHLLFRRRLDWVQRCGRNPQACGTASTGLPCVQGTSPCMSAISLEAVLDAYHSTTAAEPRA